MRVAAVWRLAAPRWISRITSSAAHIRVLEGHSIMRVCEA